MLLNIPIDILIKYYWFWTPIFLFFSGEITMITFGILSIRYTTINNFIILLIGAISSFLSEEILFLLSRYKKNFFNKYENYKFYQLIVTSNSYVALLIFTISRFFPILRIIAPIGLGFGPVGLWSFTIVNFTISMAWCWIFYYIGKLIGIKTLNLDWKTINKNLIIQYNIYKNKVFIIMGFIILFIIIIFIIKKILNNKRYFN
jgi:membrane protein DedA with SNARE-associated domain